MKNLVFHNVDPKSMLILKLALLSKRGYYRRQIEKVPDYAKDGWAHNMYICEQFLEQLRAQE